MDKKKLLLHACCAPCLSYVYESLSQEYNITVYFYNPNISPLSEYERRLEEVKQFSILKGFSLIIGDNDNDSWLHQIEPYKDLGEKSQRCWECYRFRLEDLFDKAKEVDSDILCTTLSISPHKNSKKINEIGNELKAKYNIDFLTADFKKNDGFKKSLELSRKYDFYRQKYCGCIFSYRERFGEESPGIETDTHLKS